MAFFSPHGRGDVLALGSNSQGSKKSESVSVSPTSFHPSPPHLKSSFSDFVAAFLKCLLSLQDLKSMVVPPEAGNYWTNPAELGLCCYHYKRCPHLLPTIILKPSSSISSWSCYSMEDFHVAAQRISYKSPCLRIPLCHVIRNAHKGEASPLSGPVWPLEMWLLAFTS